MDTRGAPLLSVALPNFSCRLDVSRQGEEQGDGSLEEMSQGSDPKSPEPLLSENPRPDAQSNTPLGQQWSILLSRQLSMSRNLQVEVRELT